MFPFIATKLPQYLLPVWPALTLVLAAALVHIEAVYGTLPLREIAAARGTDISRGQRLELVALARNLPENERGRPRMR